MENKVIDKEIKVIKDENQCAIIKKGNLDIELVMGTISNKNNYKTAVILGSDSDFIPVFQYLRANEKIVICRRRRDYASEELLNYVNKFIDITKITKGNRKIKKGPIS